MKKKISREFIELYNLYFIWFKLAKLDVVKRYRRSVLGPFWITITTLVTTTALSFIYSKVLNVEILEYFPYLTIGLIYWNFVSTLLNESCDTFINFLNFLVLSFFQSLYLNCDAQLWLLIIHLITI